MTADKPRLGGATAVLTYFKVFDAVNRADALRFALVAASSSKNACEFLKRIPLDVFAAERGSLYDFISEG